MIKVRSDENYDIFFIRFPTEKIESTIEYIKKIGLNKQTKRFYLTGGGAYKFNDLITKELEVDIVKISEFESLAKGLDFLNKNKIDSSFFYSKKGGKIFCKTVNLTKRSNYKISFLENRKLSFSFSQCWFRSKFSEI